MTETTWHSENIADLCAALCAAQGAMMNVKKSETAEITSTKGNFKYSYATLADCWDIARPALKAQGLSLAQFPFSTESGCLALRSVLLHSSGQWLKTEYILPVVEESRMNPHQSEGSALTYARRYSLCAILGIPTEDDDAATASQPGDKRVPPAASKAAPGMVPIGKKYGPQSPNPKAWTEVPIDYLEYCSGTDNPAMRDPARAELERRSKHSDADPPMPKELG